MIQTNVDIIFNEPEIKEGFCLLRPKHKFYFDIVDVKILKISKIKNGYQMTIFVDVETSKILKEIDNSTLINLLTNNQKWFNNDLTEEEIKEMFFASFCNQTNSIKVFIRENIVINLNNKQIDINEFITNFANMKHNMINIKLQLLGMYVYKKQTINKWYINTMNIYENTEDICMDSKEEINEFWKSMVEKCDEVLQKRIQNIETTRNNIQSNFKDIENTENTELWEKKIVELKKIIQNIIF